MNCPPNCLTCQQDTFFRSFLQCTVCSTGFSIVKGGQCSRTCNTNFGMSIVGGISVSCNDINCVNCTNNVIICNKCAPLYTLSNGACLSK